MLWSRDYFQSEMFETSAKLIVLFLFNPLNAELNPICYLLALLGAHHFLHAKHIIVHLLVLILCFIIFIWYYYYNLFKMCKSGNGKLTELFSYTGCLVTITLLFPTRQVLKPQLYSFSINKTLSSVNTHKYFPGYMSNTPCIISLNTEKCLLSYCTAALLLQVLKKHWIC